MWLQDVSPLAENTHVMSANLSIPLRPPGPPKLDPSVLDDRFHPAFTRPQPLPDATVAAFEKAKEAVSRHPVTTGHRPSGVKVLALGTGSAVPNKYRNGKNVVISISVGGFSDCRLPSFVNTDSDIEWEYLVGCWRGYDGSIDSAFRERL